VLCRLGGDEFGVLLRERNPAAAAQVGERVRKDLAAFKWSWGTHVVSTSVSIGIVDLRQVGLDVEKAMRFGDIACYMAKERGRDRVHPAVAGDKELSRHASEISWARRIKEALEHDGFCLYAQTICSTSSFAQTGGRLTAHRRNDKFRAEILLRMTGDSGKVIPLSVFMPAAERYGLMSAIDRWVVHAVFTTLANTEHRREGQYSINLSGASVGDERFLEFLKSSSCRPASRLRRSVLK
jgi:predicted signal transduction protein with EAL and GGDEF domain